VTDEIRLRGLRAFGHHGVFADERANGQEFVIDVDARLALAELGDDLGRTIHYGELAVAIVTAVETDPVDLIETVAERVATIVLGFGAVSTRVEVHKPSAPIAVPFDDVSVVIERGAM
jgi:dihydroneopterin aldolase